MPEKEKPPIPPDYKKPSPPMSDISFSFLGSWLRNPWSDVGGGVFMSMHSTRCERFEFKMMNCFEAYGYPLSQKYCRDYLEDYQECRYNKKQLERVRLMKVERKRQYKAGLREKQYADPPKQGVFGDFRE